MKTVIKLNFYQVDQVLCTELGTASTLLHHLSNTINWAIAGLSSTQMPIQTLNRTYEQNPHFGIHWLNSKQFLSAFSCSYLSSNHTAQILCRAYDQSPPVLLNAHFLVLVPPSIPGFF